jgi:hypothetical protein
MVSWSHCSCGEAAHHDEVLSQKAKKERPGCHSLFQGHTVMTQRLPTRPHFLNSASLNRHYLKACLYHMDLCGLLKVQTIAAIFYSLFLSHGEDNSSQVH